MNEKRPILSFCIPTYNRVDVVARTVKSILKYPGDDIEVVVSDNCSTDDTVKKLREIHDNRLRIFSNESNLGFEKNVFKSFEYSSGEFCFYLNDREIVFIEKIDNLKKLLYEKKYSLILTSVKKIDKNSPKKLFKDVVKSVYYRKNLIHSYIFYNKEFYSKIETIKKILIRGHPTGIIIKKSKINFDDLYKKYTYGTMYPHIFLMLQILKDDEIVYFARDFYSATLSNPHDSHTMRESKSKDDYPWYHPLSRFSQMKDKINWLDYLNLTSDQKRELIFFLYLQMLGAASWSRSIKNRNSLKVIEKKQTYSQKGKILFEKHPSNIAFKNSLIKLGEEFINELLEMEKEGALT